MKTLKELREASRNESVQESIQLDESSTDPAAVKAKELAAEIHKIASDIEKTRFDGFDQKKIKRIATKIPFLKKAFVDAHNKFKELSKWN